MSKLSSPVRNLAAIWLAATVSIGCGGTAPQKTVVTQETVVSQEVAVPQEIMGPGETFKDCADCPEMVVVPAGRFLMGRTESDMLDVQYAIPQHEVVIDRNFAVGKYEVTYGQFTKFVRETEGNISRKKRRDLSQYCPGNKHYGPSDQHPVTCVDWQDAKDYAKWLAKKTRRPYRLITEAEWEYAARAGTTTVFWWGNDENAMCTFARVTGCGAEASATVGQYQPNPFGLHDMLGNVSEWVEDCWSNHYTFAPTDGSAWTWIDKDTVGSADPRECERVIRGNSWASELRLFLNRSRVSAAIRDRGTQWGRTKLWGFRVATALP
jgi:formylglycine-generating enzyme required for sulfatase activity